MTDANVASFEEFIQGWMVRQRNYLEELLSAQQQRQELDDSDRMSLLNRVLCHYGQYYEEKSKIAQQNILLVFSPPWLSSLEKSFLWVAGFKPGMAFHVVNRVLEDLSQDQKQRLSQINQETKMKERELNDELAKVHESMAAPPLVDMIRSHGRVCLSRSFMAEEGTVPMTFKETLENLVTNADALRTETALRVVQVLKPAQVLNFFVAVAELQIKIRSLGLDKDAQSGNQG
ncbi:protein ZW2-like [Cicer arietinum]|uniref:Protein DOG1-like 4 n=1 Tax=Cicer arietinum TaxID=3827 RepID=A0A1S3EIP0_CICAR|nr:protein DOG1-like 4 [Cicer arietinum]XP_012575244.1 protein DOG1-like 4 [Cicer arietinum]XP_027186217.1 protein DOG1-like 4 [Cicer arietinum]